MTERLHAPGGVRPPGPHVGFTTAVLAIRHPLSRQRLALEIGAARRSVNRALAALASRKLLSLSPKGWQVLHAPDALRALLLPPVG